MELRNNVMRRSSIIMDSRKENKPIEDIDLKKVWIRPYKFQLKVDIQSSLVNQRVFTLLSDVIDSNRLKLSPRSLYSFSMSVDKSPNAPLTPNRMHRSNMLQQAPLSLSEVEKAIDVVLAQECEHCDDESSFTRTKYVDRFSMSRDNGDPAQWETTSQKFDRLLSTSKGEGKKTLICLFTVWRQSQLLFPQEKIMYFDVPVSDSKNSLKKTMKIEFRNQFRQNNFLEMTVYAEKKSKNEKVSAYKKSDEQKTLEKHVLEFVLRSFIDLKPSDVKSKLQVDSSLESLLLDHLWLFQPVDCHNASKQIVRHCDLRANFGPDDNASTSEKTNVEDKIGFSVHFCLMPTVQFLQSVTGCQLTDGVVNRSEEDMLDRRLHSLVEKYDFIEDRKLVNYHEIIRQNFPVAFVTPNRSSNSELSLPSVITTIHSNAESTMSNSSSSEDMTEENMHTTESAKTAKVVVDTPTRLNVDVAVERSNAKVSFIEVGPRDDSPEAEVDDEIVGGQRLAKVTRDCRLLPLSDYEAPVVHLDVSNKNVSKIIKTRNKGRRNGLAEMTFHHHQDVFAKATGGALELEKAVFDYKHESLFMSDYVRFDDFVPLNPLKGDDEAYELPTRTPATQAWFQTQMHETEYIACMAMSKDGQFVTCSLVDGRIFVFQLILDVRTRQRTWRPVFARKEIEQQPTCVSITTDFLATENIILFAVAYSNGLVRRYILYPSDETERWSADSQDLRLDSIYANVRSKSQDWVNCLLLYDKDNLILGTYNGVMYILFFPVERKCIHSFTEGVNEMDKSKTGDGEFMKQGITCLALNRKRGIVAAGSFNRSVTVWDIFPITDEGMLNCRKKILELNDHQNAIFAVAMSDSGNLVYAGGSDGAVTIWDAVMGKKLRVILDIWSIPQALFADNASINQQRPPERDQCTVKGIFLSDDSSLMTVVLQNGTIVFMDSKITDQQYDYQDPLVGWLASRDFDKLVGSKSSIREITHYNNKEKSSQACSRYVSTKISTIRDIVICDDDVRTVIVGRESEIEFLNLKTKQSRKLSLLPLKAMQSCAEISGVRIVATPRGEVVLGAFGCMLFWINSKGVIYETIQFAEDISALAISDNAECIAVGGVNGFFALRLPGRNQDDDFVLESIHSATNKHGSQRDHRFSSCVNSIAMSSDENGQLLYVLVGCANGSAHLRKNVQSGSASKPEGKWFELSDHSDVCEQVSSIRHDFAVTCVALHHGYAFTASDDKKLIIWRIDDLSVLRVLDDHIDAIKCISVCRDLPILIVGCKSESATIWFWPTGERLKTIRSNKAKRSDRISAVAISHDGKAIVTTAQDRRLVRLFVNAISDNFYHIYVCAQRMMMGDKSNFSRLPNFSDRILKFLQNRDLETIRKLRETNPVMIREYLLERSLHDVRSSADSDDDSDSSDDESEVIENASVDDSEQQLFVLEAILAQFLKDKRNLPRLRLLFEVMPHLAVMKVTQHGGWLRSLQAKKLESKTALPTELIRLILDFYSYLFGASAEDIGIDPDEAFWNTSTRRSFSPFIEEYDSNYNFLSAVSPLCDRIDINEVTELAEEFPTLFIQFANRLRPVRNYDMTIDRQHSVSLMMRDCLVAPSRTRQPKGFWTAIADNSAKESFPRYHMQLPQSLWENELPGGDLVVPFIIPVKNIAAWNSTFLSTVVEICNETEDFSMFDNPVVKLVVDFKWQAYVGWRFYFDFGYLCVWNLMVMANAVLFAHDKHHHRQYQDFVTVLRIGITLMLARLIFHEVAGLAVALHENLEAKTANRDAWSSASLLAKVQLVVWDLTLSPIINDYITDLPNFLDATTYSVALISMYYQQSYEINGQSDRDFELANAWGAILMPLLGINILHDLTGIPMVGPYIRMMAVMVQSSGSLLFILGIMLFTFSAAFMLLMDSDENFRSFDVSFVQVFAYMFGAFEFDTMYGANSPAVAVCLMIIYLFIVAVILLNLLVAIMSSKQEEILDRVEGEIVHAKAAFILEYEELIFTADSFAHEKHNHGKIARKEGTKFKRDSAQVGNGKANVKEDQDDSVNNEDSPPLCSTNMCGIFCWICSCSCCRSPTIQTTSEETDGLLERPALLDVEDDDDIVFLSYQNSSMSVSAINMLLSEQEREDIHTVGQKIDKGWLREDGWWMKILSFFFFVGFSGSIMGKTARQFNFPTWLQVLAKEGLDFTDDDKDDKDEK